MQPHAGLLRARVGRYPWRVLADALNLTTTLNELSAGLCTAPEAEARIRGSRIHHVADLDGVLGLDPLHLVGLRLALARTETRFAQTQWLLLLPRPGRLGGLRGPADVTSLALDAGAIVLASDGRLGWIPLAVGPAIQWRLVRAERPMVPPLPREATGAFAAVLAEEGAGLASLGVRAGRRPRIECLALPAGYPARSASLLERASVVLAAASAGLDAQTEIVTSHSVLGRELHLRRLADAALDAVSAAASWPSWAMESEPSR